MKIIDIGICTDNNDPKGLGRIRYVRYNDYIGEKERALNYVAWGDTDVFVANPFLPLTLNFIPEVGQSVKIINYDTDKETVNAEYIAGPFTTSHNFNGQQFAEQVENTTYGISVKHGEDVFNQDGSYKNPKSEGSLAKKSDLGIYGKYGSDIIFTEDGLQLRGGKLISRPFAETNKKEQLISQPILSSKNSSLHLKKFPQSLEYEETEVEEQVLETGNVNYFLEYEISDPLEFDPSESTSRTVDFYLYDVRNMGRLFRIENPNLENVVITSGSTVVNKNNYIQKNNPNFYTTDPIYSITVTGNTLLYVKIREVITNLSKLGLIYFDTIFKETNVHPFYFRPSKVMKDLDLTSQPSGYTSFRNEIFNNVKYFGNVGSGLIFSKNSPKVPTKKVKKKVKYIKDPEGKKQEQTFASLKSDKMYFLTTEIGKPTNYNPQPIDFTKLDKYEISQQNYLGDIEPNTYSMVRGELLVKIIRAMRDLFLSHVHGICTPMVLPDPKYTELENLLKNLETDLLNQSIRIN